MLFLKILLFLVFCFVFISSDDESSDNDADFLVLMKSTREKMQPEQMLTPEDALEYFQKANVRKNERREHFVVSRMKGNEELKSDLLSLYKDPRKNLRHFSRLVLKEIKELAWGRSESFSSLRSEDSTRWNSR